MTANIKNKSGTAECEEKVMTAINNLVITTPKGQEPIENDDGTVTLPKGGTFINPYNNDEVIAPSGTIIKKDGVALNTKQHIRVERGGQEILSVNYYGISEQETSDFLLNKPDDSHSSVSLKGNNLDWYIIYNKENSVVFEFKGGTKITMNDTNGSRISNGGNSDNGYIKFHGESIIEFPNCTTIKAPVNTEVKISKNIYIITIGDGEATVNQIDGNSFLIASGTALDINGNTLTD